MRRTLITCAGTLGILMSTAGLAAQARDADHLDVLHRQRDNPAARREALALAQQIAHSTPQDFELLWRAARVYCWEAELSSKEPASTAARRCWQLGDAAAELEPRRAEGYVWAAQGVGQWARANGVMASLVEGVEQKFLQRLDKALRLDAWTDRGTPWLMRGAFFYEIPFPKRDLNQARTSFATAVQRFPENLRVRLYLARIDAEVGNRQRALEALAKIETADAQYDPPSARRVKAEARLLAEKLRVH